MTPETLVRAFIDAWDGPRLAAIEALLHPDIRYVNGPLPVLDGRAAVMAYLASVPLEMSRWDIVAIACDGPRVLVERVDHLGVGGARIALPVMGTFEVADGGIRHWRDYFDLASFRAQWPGGARMSLAIDCSGRHALVMAGSRGIGRACAEALHQAGARLSVAARASAALDAVAASLPGACAIAADLLAPDGPARMVAAAEAAHGPVDILVVNGPGPPAGGFDALTDADWQAAADMLLMPAVRAARAVLPAMRQRLWGRILFIASAGVRQPIPGLTLSNSLRLAVLGLARALAEEGAPHHILVNSVCPGWTATDRVETLLQARAAAEATTVEALAASLAASIPLGRLATPAEIAAIVAFLASDLAGYITGTVILADGGLARGQP